MLTYLSRTHKALGSIRGVRRMLPAPPLQQLGRAWVQKSLLPRELSRTDDITVVIGVRDRVDYRLVNALRSIRSQTYPADLVRIALVDYGSMPVHAHNVRDMCDAHRADYERVDAASAWSRARCLNIGIRGTETKFVMTSDVDVVLSPRYLSDAVELLKTSPLSVVCSAMLDLPEESAGTLERSARDGEDLQLETWKEWCRPRYDWTAHPSICIAYTALYQAVRGFDEYYEGWGYEDQDLLRRLVYLGLVPEALGSGSFYLHQWHADTERGRYGANAKQTERNIAHFARSHSILRNGRRWGVGAAPRIDVP